MNQSNQTKPFSYASALKKNLVVKEETKDTNNETNETKESNESSNTTLNSKRIYRKRIKDHKTGSTEKLFSSASLTFIQGSRGYLVSNEFRWIEQKNMYHTIGGKTDDSDIDIFYTAVREFVEETNIYLDESLDKNKNCDNLSYKLYLMLRDKVKYYDMIIGQHKNLYHRFFIFNVNWFEDWDIRNKIINLPEFYQNLIDKNLRTNSELNYLKWLSEEEYSNNNNEMITNLIKEQAKKIDRFE
jgi:hypothetical protein